MYPKSKDRFLNLFIFFFFAKMKEKGGEKNVQKELFTYIRNQKRGLNLGQLLKFKVMELHQSALFMNGIFF